LVPFPFDIGFINGIRKLFYREWHKGHREQMWQLIEAGSDGVEAGNVISKAYAKDLIIAGYAKKLRNGNYVATPSGTNALLDYKLRSRNGV